MAHGLTAGFWGHCGVRGDAFCEPAKTYRTFNGSTVRNAPHDTSRTLGQAALTSHTVHTHTSPKSHKHTP